jgi:hypothetical protein
MNALFPRCRGVARDAVAMETEEASGKAKACDSAYSNSSTSQYQRR